jgi:type IV pilus assembly protein PilF
MSPEKLVRQRVIAAVVAAFAWLAGCAVGVPSPAPTGDSKDRVTASDESDASKRARLRLELASAYFGRGQMTVALDQVKLAIAADPNLVEAFNLRGLIYASLGDDKLAEESFRRALAIGPRDADTMNNFGWYLCQQRRYAESIALFNQALAVPQYRDAPRTLLALGVCQSYAGQLADSQRSLERAQELDPTNPAAAINLAAVLYQRGDYERARVTIRGVNAVPAIANAETLWLAARIEHRLGDRSALESFGNQLRRRFPESREAKAFDKGQFDE